jgi:hypothetical protein
MFRQDGSKRAGYNVSRFGSSEYSISKKPIYSPLGPTSFNLRVARDPLETGGDCSDWRLHSEHGAEPNFPVRNALVSFRSFGQWIGLND